jgi:hypothetical protein
LKGKEINSLKTFEESCKKQFLNYPVYEYISEQIGKSFIEKFQVKFKMNSTDYIQTFKDSSPLGSTPLTEFNDTVNSNELTRLCNKVINIPFVQFGIEAAPYQFEYLDKEVVVEFRLLKPYDVTYQTDNTKVAIWKLLTLVVGQIDDDAEVLNNFVVRKIH